jgi:hypothetical protein
VPVCVFGRPVSCARVSDGGELREARTVRRPVWVSRVAIAAFVGVEISAFVWWLNLGRFQWFYADEWDFLSLRTAGNLGDLFRPHHGHWTTLPILLYRFLYQLYGLHHFLPYRLVVLVLYLGAAALLLVVMWRANVHPWIAVSAATLFALFGAGSDNIINPFQVTFTGAFVAGLVLLLLTDHDGPLGRRDVFGLLAGLVGLMMSGVGVVMVMIMGIAVLLRRGWRKAAALVAPLAAIYLVWLLAIGHDDGVTQAGSLSQIGGIVGGGLGNGFRTIAPVTWFALPMTLLLVGGFVLAGRQRTKSGWAQLVLPLALLCGTVLLLASVASDHTAVLGTKGPGFSRQSRYVSLIAAMSIPALAVAVDALTRWWKWLLPLAMAMFLIAIPHNLSAARATERIKRPLFAGTRLAVEIVPRDPTARTVPGSVHPDFITAPDLTVGWLLGALERGKIPSPGPMTPTNLGKADFRLSLVQEAGKQPKAQCPVMNHPLVIGLSKGESIYVVDKPIVVQPASHLHIYPGMVFDPKDGNVIRAVRDLRLVKIVAYRRAHPPRVCIG